jgi:hypothetical protein
MKRILTGLIALLLMAGTAVCQPKQLNDKQMEAITAGFTAYSCDPTTGCQIDLSSAVRVPTIGELLIAEVKAMSIAQSQLPVSSSPQTFAGSNQLRLTLF